MTALVRMCTAPLRYIARAFACVVPVLRSSVAHTQISAGVSSTSFCVDWIADSGAGRSLGCVSSLEAGGIPSGLIKDNTTVTEFPIDFATGGGSRRGDQTIGYEGDVFGHTNAYLLPKGCPLVRSLGEIVNQQDRPFVWLPGELPFFVTKSHFLQVSCAEGDRSRIEENVPIFRENIKIVPGMPSHPIAPRHIPEVVPKPPQGSKKGATGGSKIGAPDKGVESSKTGVPRGHDSDADSEGGVEWVRPKCKEPVRLSIDLHTFPSRVNAWIARSPSATRNVLPRRGNMSSLIGG